MLLETKRYHGHETTTDLDEGIEYLKIDKKRVTGIVYMDGDYPHEINYKEGKKHGKSICWHSNGQIWSEGEYKDGQPDGLIRYWYENGVLRHEEKYENGNRIYKRCWEEDGSEIDSSDPNYKWLFE